MATNELNEIEPSSLKKVRNWVRQNVPGVQEAMDRRGFQLLQWVPARDNASVKPGELSLEHEVRLKPKNHESLQPLLEKLHMSEGCIVSDFLLPQNNKFGSLVVQRYKRDFGPQSIDRYYDFAKSSKTSLISRMITVRERIKSSKFMTWGGTDNSMRPLNLELPFIALGNTGMIVRLEFNWIDDLAVCLNEAVSTVIDKDLKLRNPLFIAAINEGFVLSELIAVFEHTTFREKFSFYKRETANTPSEEVFVLNVDHITAQCLQSGRIGSYADIDISVVKPVNDNVLDDMSAFALCVSDTYALIPNLATKAMRDSQVTKFIGKI